MLPVLSGVFFGWLAATLIFAGLAFTWFFLGKLFPRQPSARLWAALLLFVLGALPAAAIGLFAAFGAASLISDPAIAWSTRFAYSGACTITLFIYAWMARARPTSPADAVGLDGPLPPPLPQGAPLHGTFPSGHRFGPIPPEETIHFGEPDPDFTLADMKAIEEELHVEEHLATMRDPRVAAQN
jgi:hypothetical protein